MPSATILKMDVDVVSTENILEAIQSWTDDDIGRYISLANVHMCMEVFDDKVFREQVNASSLTVPDGMPLVWALRVFTRHAEQIRGTDLVLALCNFAEVNGFSIGFFGGTHQLLVDLLTNLKIFFPKLKIPFVFSPPYRSITEKEDHEHIAKINSSGVQILFVGLGCPKQEKWMSAHKGDVHCTMVGVGAAFDFIAGSKKQAPKFLQKIGMEWFFRLSNEPKRLVKRYLKHNIRFLYYFYKQIKAK